MRGSLRAHVVWRPAFSNLATPVALSVAAIAGGRARAVFPGTKGKLVCLVVLATMFSSCGSGKTISVRGPLTRGPYPDNAGGEGDAPDALLVAGNDQTVFASGQQCSIYKSSDGGRHWRVIFTNDHPNSLFEDCAFGIAGGPSETLYTDTPNGVFKSSDDGGSWRNVGLAHPDVFDLAVDPADSDTVYAGAGRGVGAGTPANPGGVYKSTNGGESWSLVGLAGQEVNAVAVSGGGRVVYAGTADVGNALSTRHGLFRSSDGGRSWRSVGAFPKGVDEIYLAPRRPATVYVDAALCLTGCVFATTDGGTSWHKTGLRVRLESFAPDPQHPRIAYAGTERGVVQSADGGASWRRIGLPGKEISALAAAPTGHALYAATFYGAVMRLTVGGTR
jgi:photosystem II stability/assembly factor-like uncharacterized protein